MVICRLWRADTQTKSTYHLHGCGGDSNVLTWGVAAPQAMVGALTNNGDNNQQDVVHA